MKRDKWFLVTNPYPEIWRNNDHVLARSGRHLETEFKTHAAAKKAALKTLNEEIRELEKIRAKIKVGYFLTFDSYNAAKWTKK